MISASKSGRRSALVLAAALCVAYFGVAAWASKGFQPLPPDTLDYANRARNLVRGNGYVIDFVQIHVGLHESVRHVPEMHGILQGLVFASLFAVFGIEASVVRLPGFAYVALTALIAFRLARHLYGSAAGLLACLLSLTNTSLFAWAWWGADDVGHAFFSFCSLLLLYLGLIHRQDRFFAMSGLLAGVALLQKLTALTLLGVFLIVPFLAWRATRATVLRWTTCLVTPLVVAMLLYVARNLWLYGSLTFPWGPIAWIWKSQGWEGAFALYEQPPELASVLASIGWRNVLEIMRAHFVGFLQAAFGLLPLFESDPLRRLTTPAFVSALGILTIPTHLRRSREFAVICGVAVLGTVAFVCCVHMEARYLSPFVPLLSVSLSGAMLERANSGRRGGRGALRRVLWGVALVGIVGMSCVAFAREVSRVTTVEPPRAVCSDAVAWLRDQAEPTGPILTFDPWGLSWDLDRSSVVIPSGGTEPLLKVARHYGASWLVLQPTIGRKATYEAVKALLKRPQSGLRAELAFDGVRCDVLRLRF
jgi:hypothetical protein